MPLKVRSPKTIITVLVTEDSETIAHALMLILNSDPKVEVVGWAKNGEECLRMVAKLRPDIVTMDIEMPLLDGIETTRAILKEHPVPILIVSSTIKGDLKKTFDALQAGAFDVIERPRL
ncbi:MAG: response regulator, partial [Nitrospinota bacterium]